jgi:cytochrome c oxidase subunit II
MLFNIPFFPPQASTQAADVDAIYLFFIAVTAFFSILIACLIVVFAVRYHRRSADEYGHPIHGSLALELTWTIIPLGIAMVMFVWGARLYVNLTTPPKDAREIYVVGKRWMWKAQHITGQREINELHVPIDEPVKLLIGSEDVLHSYYIPAFRMKMDAVPGRTTTLWFQPTQPGTYHLYCAEYCGMNHSRMIGRIVVMNQAAFQNWLGGGGPTMSLAEAGQQLFNQLGCATCHTDTPQGRGPVLKGVFGHAVKLADGSSVVADENYLRESILVPTAKMVEGFPPLMPVYQGMVTEEQLLQLIAYIKSLAAAAGPGTPGAAPASAPGAPPAAKTD